MRTILILILFFSSIGCVSGHEEQAENADPYIWGTILVVLTFVIIMAYYILGPLRTQLREIRSQYHDEIIDSEKFS